MSSRTVSVVLTAQVQNYLANMKAAEQRTLEVERASRSATQQFRAHTAAVQQFGVGMLAVGGVAAAGLALAVKASTEFGAKMAQLQSLSHANAATMKQLSDAAMTVGTAYGFSASQVADAEIELVKAGVSVQAQLGGALKGALTLAAAGQMDVAQATEITTVAMTQFALKASDVPHVADLLAAGADKALGSVADLGEGLKNGGLQAHNMGLSIDDTIGLLSAFANAGILGAEAGTQMRSMFLRLQNPTASAKAVMSEYGIAINDASGKFVGISKFATELHDKLDGLTQAQRNSALATMFGSHAIVGATVLYQDGGAAAEKAGNSIGDWIRNVNASGFASAQAAGKMNSLQGDVQKLGATFQTDLIKAGTGANDVLRGLTQGATGALNVFGQIPGPVLTAGMQITALVAGVGLVGGTALIAVPKIVLFRDAMREAGVSAKGLAGTVGKGGALVAGLLAVGDAFAAVNAHGTASPTQIEQMGVSITRGWKGLDQTFSHVHDGIQDVHGLKAALDTLGDGEAAAAKLFDSVTSLGGFNPFPAHLADTYKSNEQSLDAMGQQLAGLAQRSYPQAAQSFASLVKQYKLGGDEQKTLLNSMPAYRDALVDLARKAHVTASDQNLLAGAMQKGTVGQKFAAAAAVAGAAAAAKQAEVLATLSGQATSATTSIDQLQKQIEGFGSAQLDARSATRAMYQAIDDATAAVKKNGRGLDVTTQAGRDNQAALDGIATAADNAASKTLKQTGSAQKAAAVMQTGRDAFIKAATAMTGSASTAKKLADQLGLIPSNVYVAVKLNKFDEAKAQLTDLQSHLAALHGKTLTVKVAAEIDMTNSQLRIASMAANGVDYFGNPVKRAGGGSIDGPGPRGVDSVPALLAPGEHVLTTRDVDALGGQGGTYAFRAALHADGVQRFAKGGAVKKKKALSAIDVQQRNVQRDVAAEARARQAARRDASLLKARQKAEDRAQKAYDAISGAKADRAAKQAARATLTRAKARVKSSTAALAKQQKAVTDASSRRDAAAQSVTQLRQDREDFVSAERRDPTRNVTDPLAYVDQLRTMSRDTADYSAARRKSFDTAANRYETALVKLTAQSDAAAQKLSDLKQSSAQLHDSIAQAVAGGYQASAVPLTGAHDATTRNVASGWITRNGIRLQTYSTVSVAADPGHVTAGGIAAYYTQGGTDAKKFATDLATLAKRGLNPNLLSEIAGYGVAQGQPIVTALLSGSASQLAQVNSGYTSIAAAGNLAGTTVADANYAKQIASAEANANKITAQIKSDGEKLRKLIAQAFGLKGYATGTSSAAGGIRWVGEEGPELVGFRGGEAVLNRADSARWVRGGIPGAGGAPIQVDVQLPTHLNVLDSSDRLIGTMRVQAESVARQVVTDRNKEIAVHVMGAVR